MATKKQAEDEPTPETPRARAPAEKKAVAKKGAAPRKTATKKAPAAKKARRKKASGEPGSRGIDARDVGGAAPPAEIARLAEVIDADGGRTLATYRDPLGGHWQVVAALPLAKVAPTPFQRDLSETHGARLADVLDRLDRFLDPIITVRNDDGTYWTPNGNHRLYAMNRLGARAIVALVVPDRDVAFRILALNTEKAHNLREKALEVIRMARALAGLDPGRSESSYALEFEEPPLVTLGIAYELRGRFSGAVYHPILKRVDHFLDAPLAEALDVRRTRAERLLKLDDRVSEAVAALKEQGLTSPYLKNFVVARVNPIRFVKGEPPGFDETIAKMIAAAQSFDPSKVRADQLASASGPPPEEG
ncbi:ParB/RepB/Spo0J family partition protein [Myxococcota bacterium]|nr:ParB/RepB/Spo0J family partition protein [Myxococcota bacterium]